MTDPKLWRDLPVREAQRTVLADDEGYTLTKMSALPCRGPAPHSHPHKQLVYVLHGAGAMLVGDALIEVRAGSVVAVPPGVPHIMHHVTEPTEWLEYFTPGREDWR
ncbi:MAG: cupin domain-containing protein [Ruminococcaceae bacterium]|nr:cupin domain-containing protein [Oscillospiraceae bacterium]